MDNFTSNLVYLQAHTNPVVLYPAQLKLLITNTAFEASLPKHLQHTKDIFIFECTVGLRYPDVMHLKKQNIQYTETGMYIILHTHYIFNISKKIISIGSTCC